MKGWYGLQCFFLGIHTSLCIRWPFADTRSISEQSGFSTIRGVCSKSKTALPYYYQEENVIHTNSLTTENSKHDKQVRSRDSKIIPPPPVLQLVVATPTSYRSAGLFQHTSPSTSEGGNSTLSVSSYNYKKKKKKGRPRYKVTGCASATTTRLIISSSATIRLHQVTYRSRLTVFPFLLPFPQVLQTIRSISKVLIHPCVSSKAEIMVCSAK